MFNPRRAALDRLFSKFDQDEEESLKKLSPKAASATVEVVKPEDESEGLDPELIAQLIDALKDSVEEKPAGDELNLAKGGVVGGESEEIGMGDRNCRGCGKDSSMCRCDKMSEGGLVDGETLHDEQMRRREEARKAEQDKNAADDFSALGGEDADEKYRKPVKLSEGGLIDDETLHGEQMRRREAARKAEQDKNASDDFASLGGDDADEKFGKRPSRKSRYYGKE
jgi:hypothetical protein